MKRSVRMTAVLAGAALLLALFAFVALAWSLAGGAGLALAAPSIAADGTPSGTPVDTPTPFTASSITAGSSNAIAPAAPSTGGIAIAVTLTCATTIIGLIIAVVTLTILLRGGYGPFLRAMIFGSKARGKGQKGSASAEQDNGMWDASHTLNYQPGPAAHDDPFAPYAGYDAYDEPVAARRGSGSRGGSRSRGGERERRRSDRSDRSDRSGGSERSGRSGAAARSRGGSSRRERSRRDDWG